MPIENSRKIAAIVTLALFTGSAWASDAMFDVIEVTAPAFAHPDEVNRNLARHAHAAAVEDAVEAVLVHNRQSLDVRVADRASASTSDYTVAAR